MDSLIFKILFDLEQLIIFWSENDHHYLHSLRVEFRLHFPWCQFTSQVSCIREQFKETSGIGSFFWIWICHTLKKYTLAIIKTLPKKQEWNWMRSNLHWNYWWIHYSSVSTPHFLINMLDNNAKVLQSLLTMITNDYCATNVPSWPYLFCAQCCRSAGSIAWCDYFTNECCWEVVILTIFSIWLGSEHVFWKISMKNIYFCWAFLTLYLEPGLIT